VILLPACLFGLLSDFEEGGSTSPRNFSKALPDYAESRSDTFHFHCRENLPSQILHWSHAAGMPTAPPFYVEMGFILALGARICCCNKDMIFLIPDPMSNINMGHTE
jgi:hypothetical protein